MPEASDDIVDGDRAWVSPVPVKVWGLPTRVGLEASRDSDEEYWYWTVTAAPLASCGLSRELIGSVLYFIGLVWGLA